LKLLVKTLEGILVKNITRRIALTFVLVSTLFLMAGAISAQERQIDKLDCGPAGCKEEVRKPVHTSKAVPRPSRPAVPTPGNSGDVEQNTNVGAVSLNVEAQPGFDDSAILERMDGLGRQGAALYARVGIIADNMPTRQQMGQSLNLQAQMADDLHHLRKNDTPKWFKVLTGGAQILTGVNSTKLAWFTKYQNTYNYSSIFNGNPPVPPVNGGPCRVANGQPVTDPRCVPGNAQGTQGVANNWNNPLPSNGGVDPWAGTGNTPINNGNGVMGTPNTPDPYVNRNNTVASNSYVAAGGNTCSGYVAGSARYNMCMSGQH